METTGFEPGSAGYKATALPFVLSPLNEVALIQCAMWVLFISRISYHNMSSAQPLQFGNLSFFFSSALLRELGLPVLGPFHMVVVPFNQHET